MIVIAIVESLYFFFSRMGAKMPTNHKDFYREYSTFNIYILFFFVYSPESVSVKKNDGGEENLFISRANFSTTRKRK